MISPSSLPTIRSPEGVRQETSLVRNLLRHPRPHGMHVRVRRLLQTGVPACRMEETQARLRLIRKQGDPDRGKGSVRSLGAEEEEGEVGKEARGSRSEEGTSK